MRLLFLRAGAPLLAAAMALPLAAQDGITRQQADDILNELRQIRLLLEKSARNNPSDEPAQPSHAKLTMTGRPFLGEAGAPLTIVEFTDYQCPFCRQFHLTSFGEIKKNYIDTGKVRFYSKDLPLESHTNALRAAQAARCAGEQNQFWQLRELMSANPGKLDLPNVLTFAAGLKMNAGDLRACIESARYKSAVLADSQEAMHIGASGTPAFVIGKSTPEGVDGEVVIGALPFASFDQKLKSLEKAN